jgi:hypothetical protein
MRAFIIASVAAAVIAVIAAFALQTVQEPVSVAFSTSSVRL